VVSEVPVSELRRTCDPRSLACDTSADLVPLEAIIGQDRAVRSLQFGLEIKEVGFNVYVAGVPGTGRTTATRRFLENIAKAKPVPPDWCYVTDFRDSYRPKALSLPPGRALEFAADMKKLVELARKEIRRAFESEEYAAKKEQTVKAFREKRDDLFLRISEEAKREGFVIETTPVGLFTIPVVNGKPMTDESFLALKPERRKEITEKREKLQADLQATARQASGLERTATEELNKMDREVALYALGPVVDELKQKYRDVPGVIAHLDAVRDDMLANRSQFMAEPEAQQALPFPMPSAEDMLSRKYAVDVIVDNSELKGAPVVTEMNPTYNNLFGRIEKEAQFGALITDFSMIRGGSIHRANGGYLVLPAEEVLLNLFSWDSLKRALKNKEIGIEEAAERLGFMATKSLLPQAIPLDLKVVLIGQPILYYALHAADENFGELFKVKADFDTRMERSDANVKDYVAFVCRLCSQQGLKHLDGEALARVVEHGSRIAEDQEKLSTRFGEIADLVKEANYYATRDKADYVTASHVEQAIEAKLYRSNLLQERIQEMIKRGTIMIDVAGKKVGQVNGLSVTDLGDIAFGQPSRITASISLGREGVIDIEREVKLGGPIHSKGVMILSGYLAEKYAHDKPLSLSARLAFEQSYGGVEGDSASSAELYALISSLAGLPIKQSIAVTGSVNQKGEVQAIGGVNEKIEGFFEVCKAKGPLAGQGVVIPQSNVSNLMLKPEVVAAVREGAFHIWPVKTIDEGMEVLTGWKAGARSADGSFEQGTVNFLVDKSLSKLAEIMKDFAKEAEIDKKASKRTD
jgi:lon-related putative ATP-dependent protease